MKVWFLDEFFTFSIFGVDFFTFPGFFLVFSEGRSNFVLKEISG